MEPGLDSSLSSTIRVHLIDWESIIPVSGPNASSMILPFMKRLQTWCETGEIEYDLSHLVDAEDLTLPPQALKFGETLAKKIIREKRIMGQLDPGCMGMLNAVMNPAKLAGIGMPLELLSQSDLVAEMSLVSDKEAQSHLNWLIRRGAWFDWGTDPSEHLVHHQVLLQMKMYSAAARMVQRFGLSAIGIPYQIGLVRSVPASDLVEGMLNNSDRPEVTDPDTDKVIRKGKVIVHFNEGRHRLGHSPGVDAGHL